MTNFRTAKYQSDTAAIDDPNQTGDTVGLTADGDLVDAAGTVYALSEVSPVVTVTGTGIVSAVACEFRGLKVTGISGGPQTALIYDNTSAAGTLIDTVVFNALGTWYWDRETDTPSGGNGGRRPCGTGLYVEFSGGVSRTVDVMVA